MIKKTKGFTLIELLVVIAIIGILSSVVLASLGSARNKGADAAAKSNLTQLRASAELQATTDDGYDTTCDAGTSGKAQFDAAQDATAGAGTCIDNDGSWAAQVQLKSDTTKYFCVDSTGQASEQTGSTIGGTDFVCG